MHRKYISILIMLLGVATTACVAQTWDATKDFGASNPNGAWSYGYGITGTSFTLYPIYNTDCGDLRTGHCLLDCGSIRKLPRVAFNTTGTWLNYGTAVDPPNVLLIHPGHYEPEIQSCNGRLPSRGLTGSPDFSKYSTPIPRALSHWYSVMARRFTGENSWSRRRSIP